MPQKHESAQTSIIFLKPYKGNKFISKMTGNFEWYLVFNSIWMNGICVILKNRTHAVWSHHYSRSYYAWTLKDIHKVPRGPTNSKILQCRGLQQMCYFAHYHHNDHSPYKFFSEVGWTTTRLILDWQDRDANLCQPMAHSHQTRHAALSVRALSNTIKQEEQQDKVEQSKLAQVQQPIRAKLDFKCRNTASVTMHCQSP